MVVTVFTMGKLAFWLMFVMVGFLELNELVTSFLPSWAKKSHRNRRVGRTRSVFVRGLVLFLQV